MSKGKRHAADLIDVESAQPELDFIRPSCPDPLCKAPNCADIGGNVFECLSCGVVFPAATFKFLSENARSRKRLDALLELDLLLAREIAAEERFHEREEIRQRGMQRLILEARARRSKLEAERAKAEFERLKKISRRPPPPPLPEYVFPPAVPTRSSAPLKEYIFPAAVPSRVPTPFEKAARLYQKHQLVELQKKAVKAYCEWMLLR